jgi:hypothetical protein
MKLFKIINEEPVFCERRRYGKVMYTWLYVKRNGGYLCLNDPWPTTMPKISEIQAELDKLNRNERLTNGGDRYLYYYGVNDSNKGQKRGTIVEAENVFKNEYGLDAFSIVGVLSVYPLKEETID